MRKYLLVVLMLGMLRADAQYNTALSCEYNVYDPTVNGQYRKDCINATFKYGEGTGNCTGTLINRNTSDNDLGYYFVTARHCFFDGLSEGIDWSKDYYFYFNFQSKDANTASVLATNQGVSRDQSKEFSGSSNISNGYHYFHKSKIRIVSLIPWGDFAICEILTPIPPHFNVTYAGWYPGMYHNGMISDFAAVHHPSSDIKKLSKAHYIHWGENPIATGCYTITILIDELFGWIWGHRWSTQVICNYMDDPWFYIAAWDYGRVEHGSSGSGMYNIQNRLFGTLSGDIRADKCRDVVFEPYGKLHGVYPNAKVKNTFNPNHDRWVEWTGMNARKIGCYDNLVLPGRAGDDVSGEYFPAKEYQSNNAIVLQASNNVTTVKPIHVYPQADYTFRAGNSITLGPGFSAESGTKFVAEIGPCNGGKSANNNQAMLDRLAATKVPKHKAFDANKYTTGNYARSASKQLVANIYPVPNDGNFTIKLSRKDNYEVKVLNTLGKAIFETTITDTDNADIHLGEIISGNYFIEISGKTERAFSKILIQGR